MKTRYKPLLIAGLLFLLIAPLCAAYSIYLKGQLSEKIYCIAFAFVFVIGIVITFFIQNPIIMFGENFVTKKSIFKKKIYNWNELTQVILNAQVIRPVLIIFPRRQRAIILKFETEIK